MAAGNTTGDRLRRGWRGARIRRPCFRCVALGDSRRPVPPRDGRGGRALRAVATRREPRDGRLPRGDRARVANLELRADAAAAQRTGRPATAAPAPAPFRVREPLLRDHALRDADRDADMAVRPAPRRVPRGAQRDGGKHGDLPADLVYSGRAAATAVRRRHRGPGRPVRRVRLRRGRLDRGRRPVVRYAVGPRCLVGPCRLGRHHQGPQPLALADPAASGRHRVRRRRDGQPLLGRRHRRGRHRRRGHLGAVIGCPLPPPPGARRAPGGRARIARARIARGLLVKQDVSPVARAGLVLSRVRGRSRAGRCRRPRRQPSR